MCFLQEPTAAVVSCWEDLTPSIRFPPRRFRRVPASHHGLEPEAFVQLAESGVHQEALLKTRPCSFFFFLLLLQLRHESLWICIHEESRRRNNEGFQANPRCVLFNLLPLNYIITSKKAHTLSKQRLLTS